jgi:type I restriction enzyme S subunit
MLLSNLNLLAQAPNGVSRLRELILTLAVQGKLVPQDPSDEPASELLKKIRTEKDRLIAEGKIKRDKPLAEIDEDEMPFALPRTWEWVRFGELLDFQGGGQPPKSNFSDVPLPDYVQLIQIRDLGDKPQPVFIPRALASKFCTPSDVMVGRYGASVGKVFWGKDGAYNVALVKMVDEHQAFDRGFLFRFLLSPLGQSLFSGISRSAQDGFNKNDIESKLIPFAPLTEQSRIVARVEELMRLCDALEAKGKLEATQHAQLVSTLLATLTESETPAQLTENWHRIATHFDLLLDRPEAMDALEQTILQLAVRGLLVPQDPQDEPASELLKKIRAEKDKLIAEGKIKRDKPLPPIQEDEQPFSLPLGWEWVRVGNLGVTQTGGTPASSKPEYFDGNFPFIGPGQITPAGKILPPEKFISERGRLESAVAEPGDILMVCIGGSIGKCAAASYATAFNQQINSIHPLLASSEYVLNAMSASEFMAEVVSTATGSATPIISKGKWDLLLLPVPPLAEQSRIVTRVAQLRRLCDDLRQRLSASQSTQAHLAEALVQEVA